MRVDVMQAPPLFEIIGSSSPSAGEEIVAVTPPRESTLTPFSFNLSNKIEPCSSVVAVVPSEDKCETDKRRYLEVLLSGAVSGTDFIAGDGAIFAIGLLCRELCKVGTMPYSPVIQWFIQRRIEEERDNHRYGWRRVCHDLTEKKAQDLAYQEWCNFRDQWDATKDAQMNKLGDPKLEQSHGFDVLMKIPNLDRWRRLLDWIMIVRAVEQFDRWKTNADGEDAQNPQDSDGTTVHMMDRRVPSILVSHVGRFKAITEAQNHLSRHRGTHHPGIWASEACPTSCPKYQWLGNGTWSSDAKIWTEGLVPFRPLQSVPDLISNRNSEPGASTSLGPSSSRCTYEQDDYEVVSHLCSLVDISPGLQTILKVPRPHKMQATCTEISEQI